MCWHSLHWEACSPWHLGGQITCHSSVKCSGRVSQVSCSFRLIFWNTLFGNLQVPCKKCNYRAAPMLWGSQATENHDMYTWRLAVLSLESLQPRECTWFVPLMIPASSDHVPEALFFQMSQRMHGHKIITRSFEHYTLSDNDCLLWSCPWKN